MSIPDKEVTMPLTIECTDRDETDNHFPERRLQSSSNPAQTDSSNGKTPTEDNKKSYSVCRLNC